jgi:uncharacterized protein YoxC
MASTSVGGAMVRGPLASAGAQWAVVLLGTAYAFIGPDRVRDLIVDHMLLPILESNSKRLDGARIGGGLPQSIVIHTGGDSGGANRNLVGTITAYAAGAGFVWVGYAVVSNLPVLEQLMPVTKSFFKRATKELSASLQHVKDVLGKQIMNLIHKTDEISNKQDGMHRDIQDLQGNLQHARDDLQNMTESLDRCETGIEYAERVQNYTARGVRLLVTAVSSILPGNDRISRELQEYSNDGEPLFGGRTSKFSSRSDSISFDGVVGSPENELPASTTPAALPPTTTQRDYSPDFLVNNPDLKEFMDMMVQGAQQRKAATRVTA